MVSNCLWRNTHRNVFILNLKAARSKKPDGYKIQMLYRMVGSFSHQRSQVQLNYSETPFIQTTAKPDIVHVWTQDNCVILIKTPKNCQSSDSVAQHFIKLHSDWREFTVKSQFINKPWLWRMWIKPSACSTFIPKCRLIFPCLKKSFGFIYLDVHTYFVSLNYRWRIWSNTKYLLWYYKNVLLNTKSKEQLGSTHHRHLYYTIK